MSHWMRLPFIVLTSSGHCHYFNSYAEASTFCDWLLSRGQAFSLQVKD